MIEYIEWVDSVGDFPNAPYCISRMTPEDVARWQRWREPRYTSDEQAVDDFITVHWARRVMYPS